MPETILVEKRDGAMIITMNRPEARNAMSTLMGEEITAALDDFEQDPDCKACIFTNTGSVFCAGSDLKEISKGTNKMPTAPDGTPYGFAGMTKRYFAKPLIAAVHGKCLGGGLEMVLACDLCVASDDAIFGFPEPRVGLTAAGGGALLRIGRQIPTKRANEILLLAEPISVQEALDWGLINKAVPTDQVLDEALEMVRKIALGAPLALEYTKRTVYDTFGSSLIYSDPGWEKLEYYEQFTVNSDDAHEGSTAFAEKRTPHWTGK